MLFGAQYVSMQWLNSCVTTSVVIDLNNLADRRKREYHYKRHGTKNLIAGFAVATGEVVGKCYDRNKNVEFCDFLTYADDKFGTFEETHILADNYGTHVHMNTYVTIDC